MGREIPCMVLPARYQKLDLYVVEYSQHPTLPPFGEGWVESLKIVISPYEYQLVMRNNAITMKVWR
jgi:hypothetical protein